MVAFIAYLIYILSYKPFFLIDKAIYLYFFYLYPFLQGTLFSLHMFLLGLSIMMPLPIVEMYVRLTSSYVVLQDIVTTIGEGM